jgi:hypothetical protein
MDLLAEETHHIRRENLVMAYNERGVDGSEGSGVSNHHIRGPFALMEAPVVRPWVLTENAPMSRVKLPGYLRRTCMMRMVFGSY